MMDLFRGTTRSSENVFMCLYAGSTMVEAMERRINQNYSCAQARGEALFYVALETIQKMINEFKDNL